MASRLIKSSAARLLSPQLLSPSSRAFLRSYCTRNRPLSRRWDATRKTLESQRWQTLSADERPHPVEIQHIPELQGYSSEQRLQILRETWRKAAGAAIAINEEHGAGFKAYAEKLESSFPRAVPETVFIEHASRLLFSHGFNPETSINLVSTCRDELCRPFVEALDEVWGNSFNISSLGGMVFCGRTGFKAAMAHAPIVDGKERYVFWVAPHMALSHEDQEGLVWRPGRQNPSTACGALLAMLQELKSGRLDLQLQPSDIEMTLLKQHIMAHLPYGHVPNLTELTYAAHATVLKEVRNTAAAAVDESCEYVIISGVQIHGVMGQNFFWPGSITKFVAGEETDLYEEYAASVSTWELKSWAVGDALSVLQSCERDARLAVQNGDVNGLLRTEVPWGTVRDYKGRSLLHLAALHGQKGMARMLLDSQWKELINLQDIDHRTALEYAVQENSDEIAQMILDSGAEGLNGPWLQNELIQVVEECKVGAVKRLLRFAANKDEALNATYDRDGKSLVHLLANSSHHQRSDMMTELLELGADARAVDFFGRN